MRQTCGHQRNILAKINGTPGLKCHRTLTLMFTLTLLIDRCVTKNYTALKASDGMIIKVIFQHKLA